MKILLTSFLFLVFVSLKAQDNCDAEMSTSVDKFTKQKTIQTSSIDAVSILKVISSKSNVYYLSLRSYGLTPIAGKKGVIILFSDGTKFSKPLAEVDCNVNTIGDGYQYTEFLNLLPAEVLKFTQKTITDIRLYMFDNEIGERNARELKCGTKQLLKIKL